MLVFFFVLAAVVGTTLGALDVPWPLALLSVPVLLVIMAFVVRGSRP